MQTRLMVHTHTLVSITNLHKFFGELEGRTLKAKVVSRRAGKNEPKVYVDEVTLTVHQNVPIMSANHIDIIDVHC